MSLRPWREVVFPHEDVLKGTFQQAEFAADITSVHEGKAGPGYLDPALFFDRTFITEGIRLLIYSVLKRLSGQGGDPVIQLQTAFGGGKTHTLLAVYHLVSGKAPATKMQGIPGLLDSAGLMEAPKARIVVLDGARLSPNQPMQRGSQKVRTLWGELAWQLGGAEAYAQVAAADTSGTAPGKEVLLPLLQSHAPCVILMDELVAYIRQFEEGKHLTGGSFDSNLSFVQNLTEALKGVPSAVLLASLPESDKEAGSQRGVMALNALAHYFGRVHALWKPVAAEEAFEIVRRRLFAQGHDKDAAKAACRADLDLYTDNKDDFPIETQDARYAIRMEQAYPIHPEVFDRLYEDWSTLETFQRTRGVLKLMAKVIYRLWKDGNNDPLIMPGSLPLYDPDVRNEMVYYLPAGWDPVVERDIDGNSAETAALETLDTRLGAVQACRRTARAVFLGSAPGSGLLSDGAGIRGIEQQRVVLGTAMPGQQVGLFRDALRRIAQSLHYINSSDARFWFDTRPNLRREMEERKRKYQREDIFPVIRTRLQEATRGSMFVGVHIFTPSQDIPDDEALRLVVLDPGQAYSRNGQNQAYAAALDILKKRGEQPRVNQNRLLFLAADYDGANRLLDQVRTVLAWKSIEEDIRELRLNLDQYQTRQARQGHAAAQDTLQRMVTEVYKWLISPMQNASVGSSSAMECEPFQLNAAAQSLPKAMEQVVRENELVISEWAPIHLFNLLKQWFWKAESPDMPARDVWQHMCRQVYLPRLKAENTFGATIQAGSTSRDFFGLAQGREGDRYLGFSFGAAAMPFMDAATVLISPEASDAHQALLDEERRKREEQAGASGTGQPSPPPPTHDDTPAGTPAGAEVRPKTRFYAAIDLDPHGTKLRFNDI
ncbi:MAG: DUF499 domain-containing protein, partial [Deltaproteobacteria bacterium]|nr:DUF499 domain-containing protein [Deltaproteobacteria bacterium]